MFRSGRHSYHLCGRSMLGTSAVVCDCALLSLHGWHSGARRTGDRDGDGDGTVRVPSPRNRLFTKRSHTGRPVLPGTVYRIGPGGSGVLHRLGNGKGPLGCYRGDGRLCGWVDGQNRRGVFTRTRKSDLWVVGRRWTVGLSSPVWEGVGGS